MEDLVGNLNNNIHTYIHTMSKILILKCGIVIPLTSGEVESLATNLKQGTADQFQIFKVAVESGGTVTNKIINLGEVATIH